MQIRSLENPSPSPANAREGVGVSGPPQGVDAASAPVALPGQAASPRAAPDAAAVAAAVDKANAALKQVTSGIEFHVDPSTKRMRFSARS